MSKILIRNVTVVPGHTPDFLADVLIEDNFISKIGDPCTLSSDHCTVIDGTGLHLFPGIIDSQVHFREPGLTHKATISTESRAAIAGGVTSYMEMPNTNPPATTIELLEDKYAIASHSSLANYSFFMGTTNSNLEELKRVSLTDVCGIKIFMGSSTGNMCVDDEETLHRIFSAFSESPYQFSAHCEDDNLMRKNLEKLKEAHLNSEIFAFHHPEIRNDLVCFSSSSRAVRLALQHDVHLHVLHISTEMETGLFSNKLSLLEKKITAEACVHHLNFTDTDYTRLGNFIKWNPAIKSAQDQQAIWNAILDGTIDVISTDHAPHTLEEKNLPYLDAPSGGPLVQHGFNAMLQSHHEGKISLQRIAQLMCNNQATLFKIDRRGFIKEGYFADLTLVDLNQSYTVAKDNTLYKCGWSPFEGKIFQSVITHVLVNGHLAFKEGTFDDSRKGKRLVFNRN